MTWGCDEPNVQGVCESGVNEGRPVRNRSFRANRVDMMMMMMMMMRSNISVKPGTLMLEQREFDRHYL